MKYVYIEVADDWACLWRCPPNEPPRMIFEDHELDIGDLVAYANQNTPIELEYYNRRGFPLDSQRNRLPRNVTLEDLINWSEDDV